MTIVFSNHQQVGTQETRPLVPAPRYLWAAGQGSEDPARQLPAA